ncbi:MULTISPECIES: diacylglycerol kinase family protein [unclassified Exiguobacterium]|uniref:diacylglycerol/lipid kinase family protein n=1 Tax=unclassified Exiguobacterium TaxID=2644629 RepID=UPI001BED0129|nr:MULTISPECIES: diacylglycerol kinase family protein [unclassified Exiguobacterium]
MKLLMISNPSAGTNRSGLLEDVISPLAEQFNEIVIKQTSRAGDAQEFAEEAGDFDALVVLGGDGTVFEVINGLAKLETRPILGIVPGGTCNDFARTLGLPMVPRLAAEMIATQQIVEVDLGQVNDTYFLNFLGLGLIAEASIGIDTEEKVRLGKMGYYLSTIRSSLDAKPFAYELELNEGQKMTGEAVLILAANGESLGGIETNLSNGAYNDGKLDLVIVDEVNLATIRDVILQKIGLANDPSFTHILTSGFTLKTDSPKVIDTDGEKALNSPVEVKVLPEFLKMYAGQNRKLNRT